MSDFSHIQPNRKAETVIDQFNERQKQYERSCFSKLLDRLGSTAEEFVLDGYLTDDMKIELVNRGFGVIDMSQYGYCYTKVYVDASFAVKASDEYYSMNFLKRLFTSNKIVKIWN